MLDPLGAPSVLMLPRQPVRYMGPPVPPDRADGKTQAKPQPQMPPAVMPYTNPTVQQQHTYGQAMGAMPQPGSGKSPEYDAALAIAHEQAKARVAQAAARYGTTRLNQLNKVRGQLPPELAAALQSLPMVDPAAAWRAISGQFAAAAQNAGYADPRMWLMSMLNQPRVSNGLDEGGGPSWGAQLGNMMVQHRPMHQFDPGFAPSPDLQAALAAAMQRVRPMMLRDPGFAPTN